MGLSGVATSPDENAVHWNNAKAVFLEKQWGASLSYLPWLSNLTNDMYVGYLSGFWKIDEVQTVAGSFRYFDRGNFDVLNDQAGVIGGFSPNELAFDATYSRKLSDKIGVGLTARYILSNIRDVTNPDQSGNAESAFATDLGFYYTDQLSNGLILSLGAHISNLGPKIKYVEGEFFLPTNLRWGGSLRKDLNVEHSLTFSLEFNKLLVPTPPIVRRNPATGDFEIVDGRSTDRSLLSGVFGSFSDAPSGFSEEIQEISTSLGVEYLYKEFAALRLGYFSENKNKGNRKFITTGVGFDYKEFGLDFSYIIPTERNHPLGETLQITLSASFN